MASNGRLINYISQARYEVLSSRYVQFHDAMNDPAREVVRVFDPLTANQMAEIQLSRDVSRELQKKKQEDRKKTASQAVNHNIVATPKEDKPKALGEQQ